MKKRLKYFILAVLCFIFTVFTTTSYIPPARAEINTYITSSTNVLEDLERSKDFKKEDFVEDLDDYSLKIITIFEGDDDNLFVYVHQPSANIDIKATSINISKTSKDANTEDELNYRNYNLEYLNNDGVFFKYVVKDFIIDNVKIRWYDISSIFRAFNETYGDKKPIVNNTISEVSFPVAKQYSISGVDNNIFINVYDIELIDITEKYVGFMRYNVSDFNFSFFLYDYFDVHYIAFSTKREIEDLLEVDIGYTYDYKYYNHTGYVTNNNIYKENIPGITSLEKGDLYEVGDDFWLSKEYSWNAIEKPANFISGIEDKQPKFSGLGVTVGEYSTIKESVKEYVNKCDWVVRFAVTDYSYFYSTLDMPIGAFNQFETYIRIKDCTLLRLKFETEGKTYNLGVLDNKQSGSNLPDNENSLYLELKEEIKVILAIVLLLAFIVICFPLIKLLFKVIFVVLKFIFFDVLLAPIRWLLGLFER